MPRVPHGSPVQRYRRRLQATLAGATSRSRSSTSRQLAAVLQTLLDDFDRIFSTSTPPGLQRDIEQYCYQDSTVCPICGKELSQRKGKYGDFLGCSDYPNCHGSRKIDGSPSLNDALRGFLNEKKKEAGQSSTSNTNRFSGLEL